MNRSEIKQGRVNHDRLIKAGHITGQMRRNAKLIRQRVREGIQVSQVQLDYAAEIEGLLNDRTN